MNLEVGRGGQGVVSAQHRSAPFPRPLPKLPLPHLARPISTLPTPRASTRPSLPAESPTRLQSPGMLRVESGEEADSSVGVDRAGSPFLKSFYEEPGAAAFFQPAQPFDALLGHGAPHAPFSPPHDDAHSPPAGYGPPAASATQPSPAAHHHVPLQHPADSTSPFLAAQPFPVAFPDDAAALYDSPLPPAFPDSPTRPHSGHAADGVHHHQPPLFPFPIHHSTSLGWTSF